MLFQPHFFNLEYIYYQVFLFFQKIGLLREENGDISFAGYYYIYGLKLVLIFIAVFLTFMCVDFLYRLIKLRREEREEILGKIKENQPSPERKNARWEAVEKLLASDNPSDLKLAVIEADKMLDDLLNSLGYKGETLGDKLLSIEKGDMESLDDAWEAHKYRNKIAHEAGFEVTQREARRIASLYAKVFREFQFI